MDNTLTLILENWGIVGMLMLLASGGGWFAWWKSSKHHIEREKICDAFKQDFMDKYEAIQESTHVTINNNTEALTKLSTVIELKLR